MAFFSVLCCRERQYRKEVGKKSMNCRVFTLKELHAATKNFNYDNKLGEGSFGSVYWGQLGDNSEIAVKRLKVLSDKTEIQFGIEVEILGRTRHKNLLTLRGYCSEGQERLIVFDYMPNQSLYSHLHGPHSSDCLLDWKTRMDIALGSAEGICYLHQQATPHIIHRDIKASNVLLNSALQAQVADFGFAKLIPDGASHVTTSVKGTLGYLAPEYAMLGKASESCDVYSFGILLLELVSGRSPIEYLGKKIKRTITEWAIPFASERKFGDMVDKKLKGVFVEDEVRIVVLVALACGDGRPYMRPTMEEVVELLKGTAMEKMAAIEEELFKGILGREVTSPTPVIVLTNSDVIQEEK